MMTTTLCLCYRTHGLSASIVRQQALSHHMRVGDALIAAMVLESAQSLCPSNVKHFRTIPLLEVVWLVP